MQNLLRCEINFDTRSVGKNNAVRKLYPQNTGINVAEIVVTVVYLFGKDFFKFSRNFRIFGISKIP